MSKKRRSTNKKGSFKQGLFQHVMTVFDQNPSASFNYKQLSKVFGFKDFANKRLVIEVLEELEKQGKIRETHRGRYRLMSSSNFIAGVVDMTSRGAAYIVQEGEGTDIYIAPKYVNTALNGDLVKVSLFASRNSQKLEGEIVEIVQREKTDFVGILQKSKNFSFLVPDDPKVPVDIFISNANLKGAKDGEKCIAKITEWPKDRKNPFGKIVEVLGTPGHHETEMHAILAEYGLPYRFPHQVEKEANNLDLTISAQEIKKRRDFRTTTTFTIDPKDAKDFDDALSLKQLENGNWEIGIHIADVSHYVQEDSLLEKEAYARATSIYLVDRVVPMLPEVLSNEACSLRPQETKLCFSAVFEMDKDANVKKEWFGRTVIFSDRRFTYEEAQERIETKQGDLSEEILLLDGLAKKLRAKRFQHGAINFNRVEVKFHLDEEGDPIGIYFKESKDANQLIEEFMLLANKRVAEFIGKAGKQKKPKTFVYRVHDEPNADKLLNLSNFVNKLGYNLATDNNDVNNSINQLLKQVKGTNEEGMIEELTIRTMAKATYSTQNIGHYGLSFPFYTHFTSPIRRYPDVMVHRLLQHYLDGGNSANTKTIEDKCKHSSKMELLATEAERKSIKYKQVQFLEDKIGHEYDGVISGISQWGIYVEITENMCEGMIKLDSIPGDYYAYDQENYCAVGERTGQEYRMGDELRIRVKRADLIKKQLDFELVT